MLFMLKAHISKPEGLSNKEFYGVWLKEAEAAVAAYKAGVIKGGSELKPVSTATSVRFSGGKPRTVDGPFAETKEQLAGYYVIETPNLEEALAWAGKMPGMTQGTVEVRPLAVEA